MGDVSQLLLYFSGGTPLCHRITPECDGLLMPSEDENILRQ